MEQTMRAAGLVEAYKKGERRFYGEYLEGATIGSVNLSGAAFVRCDFDDVDFRGAVLEGCTFSRCRFHGTWVAQANLKGSVFQDMTSFAPRGIAEADVTGMDISDIAEGIGTSNVEGIVALLIIEAQGDAEKLACVHYIEEHQDDHCWEGFVRHFRETNPKELLWGLRALKKYAGVRNMAESYEYQLMVSGIEDPSYRYEGALAGKLASGQEVLITDYYGAERLASVQRVQSNGLIVVTPKGSTSEHFFMPNGMELTHDRTPRRAATLSIPTTEDYERLEHMKLVTELERTRWTELSTATLKSIQTALNALPK